MEEEEQTNILTKPCRQTSLKESFGLQFFAPSGEHIQGLPKTPPPLYFNPCSTASQISSGWYCTYGRLHPNYRQSMIEKMYSYFELKKEIKMSPCCNGCGNDNSRKVVSCVSYDRDGYLLAVINSGGAIAIYQNWQFRNRAAKRRLICASEREAGSQPLLCMHSHRRNEAVRWNPLNQNEIGVGSRTDGDVYLFDLEVCKGDKPTRILKYASSGWRNGKPSLQDIQYCDTHPQKIYGATRDGQIQIWDRRSRNFPVTCLNQLRDGERLGCINSIAQSSNLFFGAGDHGVMYVWDMRMTSTSSNVNIAFATQKTTSPPLLASVDINFKWQQVQLQNREKCAWVRDRSRLPIHSISTNPKAHGQIAFLLGSGGTGIIDVAKLDVTHMHTPPGALYSGCDTDSGIQESFSGKKRLAWSPTENVLISPSPFQVYILFPDKHSESFRSIELDNLAAAVDVNPSTSEIILGSPKNSIISYHM